MRTLRLVEAEFWDRQRTWTLWIPLLTSGTVVWLGVMGLAAFAVRSRRQRSAEIRRRWASEEAVETERHPEDPPAPPPADVL